MSGRGWKRWKSGGLYVSNGCKHGIKKQSRTCSEEFLVGCGRIPPLVDGRNHRWRRQHEHQLENGKRVTRSEDALDDQEAGEGSIPWLDQRSRLPPSLGWYSPRKRGKGFLKSFESSNKEFKREKTLEESFDNHFEKQLASSKDSSLLSQLSSPNSNGLDEEDLFLSQYEDVSFDIAREEEFECGLQPLHSSSIFSHSQEDTSKFETDDVIRESPYPKDSGENCATVRSPVATHSRIIQSVQKEATKGVVGTPRKVIAPWDHHPWTSRDLRRYLVLKASERLGGPSKGGTIDLILPKDTTTKFTQEKELTSRTTKRSLSRFLPNGKKAKNGEVLPAAVTLAPKEMILLRGGTPSIGESSQKNFHPVPPPLRQRHWSLPSIILTHSEDISPPRDASPSSPPSTPTSSSSSSMKYLQVPRHLASSSHFPRRACSLKEPSACPAWESDTKMIGERALGCRQKVPYSSRPCGDNMTSAEVVANHRRGRMNSQLESLLFLICDSNEEDTDEDREMDGRGSPPPDKRPAVENILDYEDAVMYGRYSANLAEYAREEAQRVRHEERQTDEVLFSKELQPYRGRVARGCFKLIRPIWDNTFARLGEDWVFLFFLGTTMATLSFVTDYIVYICFTARMYLHDDLLHNIHWTLQLFAWVTIPTLLVIFSAAFCQWLAPSAAGSGIPEMKTILRGVILKEYLTWRTLVAKIVGLATVIGAGLPLGKEGPVMHMASIVSTMLMNLLKAIKGVVDSEAHSTDLLAAASTMGVAVCYAAPIGGVLFSIEVTTVYFAVRNYWRGFYAAVVGAMFYRLMHVWFMNEETIYPIYKVEHNFRFPYDVVELLPFLCIGIFCGFAGSLFVFVHRRYVIFVRQNKTLKKILAKKRLLYPTFIAIIISVSTFPDVLGDFMASRITTKQQILDLFSNVTWTVDPSQEVSFGGPRIPAGWINKYDQNFHLSLFIFQIVTVIEIAIASTLPVPNGILIPLLKVGAAFGRQIGEVMVYLYPLGLQTGYPIIPGAYAMVGAAAFCAAITHTISISVIVFELTGQITYVIPIMIGVLISNCISSLLQPSIYDSVIRIKKLPYLPDIITTTSDVYNIYVDDIMVRDVKYIWYGITYMDLKNIIKENRKLKYFPIVDKHDSMILLGSIPRIELVRLLVNQISSDKRKAEAKRRYLEALKKRWEAEDLPGEASADSKIRYEDEVNTDDDVEEDQNTKDIFSRLSRTLSRSLSRSSRSLTRSLSRSQSQSNSRHHSPDRSDSEPPTPQPATAAFKLKELFPSKSPARKEKEQCVEKNSDELKNTNHSTSEQGNRDGSSDELKDEERGDEPDESKGSSASYKNLSTNVSMPSKSSSEESSPKKKSALGLLRGIKQKKNSGSPPFIKNKVRLTRSNSLDSIRPRSRNLKYSSGDNSQTDGKKFDSHRKATSPKKGILKRRNSFSLGSLNTVGVSPADETNYQTVTVIDTRLRNAFMKIRRMKEAGSSSMEFKLSQISLFKSKKREQAKKKAFDMTEEEREVWELRELSLEVDFTRCHIDPAPFQLVERTSLLRVHSLFSMLGINHAYVTAIGRLIGVVSLKEVRTTIEGQYLGKNASHPSVKSKSATQTSSENVPWSGTFPQQISPLSSIPPSDPEAGTVFRRSVSKNHLAAPFANGFEGK